MDSPLQPGDGNGRPADAIRAHFGQEPIGDSGLYSITGHFSEGCRVLLTGASGYIGSLVLEKLLRSTAVGHVYLLLRPRRGASPAERVAKLLSGPLFHLIDDAQAARVSAVAGDILEPGLGLSPEDEALLVETVDTVIHSAADIRLDAPIHDTLLANYRGSCAMARLVARMPRLRSFVYVSTCYVNINKPQGFKVEERIYSLTVGGREVDAAGVAEELLALPEPEAEALAAKYIDLWGFKNTYAMGKHLAEKAVAAVQRERGLPLVIVRPALVSGVAAEPYPGYSGNFAGQVGGAVAYLVGLYNDQPEAVASDGGSVWDVVPGDVVAHATIAAAAAGASAAARERIVGPLRAAAAGCDGKGGEEQPLMVVHVGSSSTYPLTMSDMFNHGVVWCAAHRRPFTLAFGRARAMDPNQQFNEPLWRRYMRSAANKVNAIVWVLKFIGGRKRVRLARMLDAGLKTYETINILKYDLRLFFGAGTLTRLEDCLVPEEREAFRVVWRPPTAAAKPPKQLPAPAAAPDAAPAPASAAGAGGKKVAPEADDIEGRKARIASAVAASKAGGWALFHYNLLAYLWRVIYSREVPSEAAVPAGKLQRLLPHISADEAAATTRVYHTFASYA
ncbi:hypothetical protein Rsub_10109 [Raphidocelis subcapitata]|uniref:Fatty acyl-CoA reductase n=1 Tax=Raphidocelis subcapitata TaxID=307507 RepID=A0A2V0PB63_9CHLO|nr:hypothetical protein Rsub_10109 [Raphidocelis subcapitata]|eukprot:GBF97098.1 hypothetical protein Rsub_10109 [Raphidocelis subcapitata]